MASLPLRLSGTRECGPAHGIRCEWQERARPSSGSHSSGILFTKLTMATQFAPGSSTINQVVGRAI